MGAGKRLAWIGVLGGGRVGRCWVRMYEASLDDRQPIIGAYRPRNTSLGNSGCSAPVRMFWFIKYEQELGARSIVLMECHDYWDVMLLEGE